MSQPQRVVRVPLYALLVMIAVAVVSPGLTMLASVTIANRATASQVDAVQKQAAQLREEQRLRSCSVYGALISALTEDPPRTESGKALLGEYRRQFEIRGCTPAAR